MSRFAESVARFNQIIESDEELRRLQRSRDPKDHFDLLRKAERSGLGVKTRQQPKEPFDKAVKPSSARYMSTFGPERYKKGIEAKPGSSEVDKERAALLDKRRISRWYELKSRHSPLSHQYPRRGRAADKDDYERHHSEREPIRKRLKLLRAAKRAGVSKL